MSPRIRLLLGHRRLSIWILLTVQILLILSYFYLKVDDYIETTDADWDKISFVRPADEGRDHSDLTYHTTGSKIFLGNAGTRDSYMDFNSSLCYINGTDVQSMRRTKDLNWQCNCLPGWHGKDCGQPEVIWRAFLTYRKPIKVRGPRTFQRRIIYLFSVDRYTEIVTEIRVNELSDIVDLFVLYENETSDYIRRKLDNGFLKNYHDKIFYVKEANVDNLWRLLKQTVRNMRNDDVILTSGCNEIPNKYALNFLKNYDRWPEPIRFRLRWSVFGFFWVHPSRTIITGGASSVAYLKEAFNGLLHYLSDNKTLSNPTYRGIILGDLNHYGGWYCEYCQDPAQIVEYLGRLNSVDLDKIGRLKIDVGYIEDVIENGLYIDGKVELVKARRYKDKYFAPYHVLELDWKYDVLLINFYSKLDYYEG